MPQPGGKPRPKYRLEITEDRPEDDPVLLAKKLAEALMNASLRQTDAEAFAESSRAERTKARQFQDILFQLKEREKNPPAKVSRMDPLSEYDAVKIKEELEIYKKRAVELQEESDQHAESAKKHRVEAEQLQRKIHELRNKK